MFLYVYIMDTWVSKSRERPVYRQVHVQMLIRVSYANRERRRYVHAHIRDIYLSEDIQSHTHAKMFL